MNDVTRETIQSKIKSLSVDMQALIQDLYKGFGADEIPTEVGLLSLAIDELMGYSDPTCSMIEMFALEPDKDLDMMDSKEAILHNRKTILNYIKHNITEVE